MIVALGLSLKVATIILGWILSMLLSDFNALGPINIPTPTTVALAEFFHADTVGSIHPLPVSWYLISSLYMYLCSCMHYLYYCRLILIDVHLAGAMMIRHHFWSFGDYGISLHCHYSQVHSDPEYSPIHGSNRTIHLLYFKPFNCM